MVEQLKSMSVTRNDLEGLIELSAFARTFAAECDEVGVQKPDWLVSAQDALNTEIKARIRGNLLKRKSEISARLESLKTPQQRKSELSKELREIEAALA